MNSESRLSRFFILTLIATCVCWSFAFVFSAIAGELPFPKETLKKAGTSLNKDVHTVKETESADLAGVEKISLEFKSADVDIAPSDDEKLRVEFEGTVASDGKVLEITRDGSELKIKTRKGLESKLSFDFSGDHGFVGAAEFLNIHIHVPRKYQKALSLALASGDVRVKDLALAELEMKVASGDVRTEDSQIAKVAVKMSSGDLKIKNLKGALSAKLTSGELKLSQVSGPSISLRLTSGDMNLEDIDAEDVEALATSGDIQIRLKDTKGWKFKLHTLSGDVTNSLSDDPQSHRQLRADVTSGDITIK